MRGRVAAAWALFASVAWLPLLPLLGDALAAGSNGWIDGLSMVGRRWGVLAATIALAACSGAVAAAAGGWAALAAWNRRGAAWRGLVWAAVLAAPIPAYLHALAWMPVLAGGSGRIRGLGGWLASGWVIACSAAPLAFLVVWIQLRGMNPSIVESARLWAPDRRVRQLILSPLLRPSLLAAGSIVYLLTMTDYAAASLFAADPWALQIFAEFSGSHDAGRATLQALPAVAAALPAAAYLIGWVRRAPIPSRGAAMVRPDPLKLDGALLCGAGLMLLAVLWMGSSLVWQAGTGSGVAAGLRWGEAGASLAWSMTGALLAVVAGAGVGHCLGGGAPSAAWLAVVAPLAFPAPLIGIGLIRLWNVPWGDAVYGTPIMLVLALAARFSPVAALVVAAHRARSDNRPLEAASLYARPWRAWLRVDAPLAAPGWAAAACLCFALALPEIAATMPVAPPGVSTVGLRLYNYLHYGAGASVAAMALVLAAGSAAAAGGAAALLSGRRRA